MSREHPIHEDGPPPSEPAPEETVGKPEFRCPDCGAATTWDPGSDALSCDYCGRRTPVPRADGEVRERALDEAGAAARGLGIEQRAVRCGECGATVALDGTATAGHCVFCGSSSVLPQSANRNVLRPESLIPLEVGRAGAEQGFRKWLAGLWFRPGALRRLRASRPSACTCPTGPSTPGCTRSGRPTRGTTTTSRARSRCASTAAW